MNDPNVIARYKPGKLKDLDEGTVNLRTLLKVVEEHCGYCQFRDQNPQTCSSCQLCLQLGKDGFMPMKRLNEKVKCRVPKSCCHHRDDNFEYGCEKEDEYCARKNEKLSEDTVYSFEEDSAGVGYLMKNGEHTGHSVEEWSSCNEVVNHLIRILQERL